MICLLCAAAFLLALLAIWITWRVARTGMPNGEGAQGVMAGSPESVRAHLEAQQQALKDRLLSEAFEAIEGELARRAQERNERAAAL
jgi:hypothetical protein